MSIKLVPEEEGDRRAAALMKYMAVESSEERQKRKREELDAKPVLPSSTLDALPPSAVKIIKNFHFGSADCEDVPWTAASFGVVPRSGVRLKGEAETEQKLFCDSLNDVGVKVEIGSPSKTRDVSCLIDYGNSDSD